VKPPILDSPAGLQSLYRGERRRLWALADRMTGSIEDAEDVVQEAFARALARGRATRIRTRS
jgi:DNA-directed RNA polymerase specialized sigma24 family protein